MKKTLTKQWGKCLLLLVGLGIGTTSPLSAQITFQRNFNIVNPPGSAYINHRLKAVAQDANTRDYYYAGSVSETSTTPGMLDYEYTVISKANRKGEIQWSKYYHHLLGSFEAIRCVYDDNNNTIGLVAVGNTRTSTGSSGYQFLLTDLSGNILAYSFADIGDNGTAYHVEQTKNSSGNYDGFIVVGYELRTPPNGDNVLLNKYNNSGSLVWSNALDIDGLKGDDRAFCVQQCASDQGYILTGRTGNDLLVMRTDALGNPSWTRRIIAPSGTSMRGSYVIEKYIGGNPFYYVLADHGPTGDKDLALLKFAGNGAYLWMRNIYASGDDIAYGLTTDNNDFIISATSNNTPVMLKVDEPVTTQYFAWAYVAGVSNSKVIKTTDNGFALAAYTTPNSFFTVKTDANGVSGCEDLNIDYAFDDIIALDAFATTVTTGNYSERLITYTPEPLDWEEALLCGDLCGDITPGQKTEDVHICGGNTETLSMAPCSPFVSNIKWFKLPNLITPVGTGNSLAITPLANATYKAYCYNEDGCPLAIVTFNVTVSPAPLPLMQVIESCENNTVTLTSPCSGPGITTKWINPASGNVPSVQVTPSDTDTFEVVCLDSFGCVVGQRFFIVNVNPPSETSSSINVCLGDAVNFDSYATGSNCSWTNLGNGQPFAGGSAVVLPLGSYSFKLSCTDENGCPYYFTLNITVVASLTYLQDAYIDCSQPINLNAYAATPCGVISNWYVLLGSMKIPVGPSMFILPPGTTVYGDGPNCCHTELRIHCVESPGIMPGGNQETTGIKDEENVARIINIYPNPNNGHFSLLVNEKYAAPCDIRISDISGKTVWSASNVPANKPQNIDLSNMAKGVYQVSVTINGQVTAKKIVLQ